MWVAAELASRGHQIDLIRSEVESVRSEPVHDSSCNVREHLEVNDNYDLVLANFGDNFLFHASVFDVIDRSNILGVFHDFFLYNLFSGWIAATEKSFDQRRQEILEIYGANAAQIAEASGRGALDIADLARATPMTEWVARWCAGALVHSGFYQDRVLSHCLGPVAVAPLPWKPPPVNPPKAQSGGKLVLLTVGVINPNKSASLVVEAIGASPPLRDRIVYRLVGPIEQEERERIEQIANRLSVAVEIMGSVDDQALFLHLESASIIACLRHPVLEGASASAIEGMMSGRPIIVNDAGFYADLPSQLVFKLSNSDPRGSLTTVLEKLVLDPHLRLQVGGQAKAWAEDQFTVRRYADILETAMVATMRALPVQQTGKRFGQRLAQLGLCRADPAVDRIAGILDDILNI